MAEITFLLGAGASYNSIPTVSEMFDRMGETIAWFNTEHLKIYPSFTVAGESIVNEKDDERKKIVADLVWLKSICNTGKNFSVDTYARKLQIAGKNDEYVKLKNVLSLYFTLEQRKNLPDVRYDNFWASILKSRTKFPDNIKIISWNYDFQLELTYSDFLDHDSLKVARETLNICSQETEVTQFRDPSKFGIFKLNGSATFNSNTFSNRDTSYLIDNFKTSEIEEFVPQLIGAYDKLCTNPRIYKNHLSFAWEHQTDNPFFNHLKESICNTEILVVIGYSFPFFNRDIDKLILNKFVGNNLKKVYFQAPDAEDLRERFLAINDSIHPSDLVLRKDIKQFTLPNEL